MGESKAINIESLRTWPPHIVSLLHENLDDLRSFERERHRIDELAIENVELRINRPPNPYSHPRQRVLSKIEMALQEADVVGYHCSRLDEDDLAAIAQDGMLPLSASALAARINKRIQNGTIPEHLGERMLAKNGADDRNRRGLLWFVSARSALLEEAGVGRLLGLWGGEALYSHHQHDPEIGPLLCTIGLPRIVIAHLPVKEYEIFGPIAKRIVSAYLWKNRVSAAISPDFEGYVTRPIEPARIERIVTLGDPEFEALTRSSSWYSPLH